MQTLTQNVVYPGLQLYVNLGALFTAFWILLLVLQSGRNSPLIGPITKPVDFGPLRGFFQKNETRLLAPFITFSGAYAGIIFINYFFTQFTFLPSVSFWTSLTPKLFFSSGGIIETIVLGAVPVTLILIVARPLIEKPWLYMLIVSPLLCTAAVLYHGYAYPGSPKALSIIWGEFYMFNAAYRGTRLLFWVPALLHALVDIVASP